MLKKIILAPDSFKGTLDAAEICSIEKDVLERFFPSAEIHSLPMSDGGEGMVDACLNIMGGTRTHVTVCGPLGKPINASYGMLANGSAVIEMAAAAGLTLVEGNENPMITTTYGVGELILDARKQGAKKILLGLGGSCTNDCGIGMAAALGFHFYDDQGQALSPIASNLIKIQKIQQPANLLSIEICAACDVNNPLTGANGATYTFAPQKGADPLMMRELEAGMQHFSNVLERYYPSFSAELPGTGAAGGMGAAVLTFLHGELKSGIELLLDTMDFDQMIQGADLVITGEGRIDWQSANGKVLSGIGRRCKKAQIPCLAVCGSIGKDAEQMYSHGITAIFSTVKGAASFEEIKQTSSQDLSFLTESIARMLILNSSLQEIRADCFSPQS